MDRSIERLFDDSKNKILDEIYSLVEDLTNELSDLQDKYDILEKEKEDSYQQGYTDGANAATTDILG